MKVAVIGCGAMGSIYASQFANAGHDVIVIDKDESKVHAINTNGLRVIGPRGDKTVKLDAFTEVKGQRADMIVVAVKAMYVKAILATVKKLVKKNSIVVTIQNGIGSAAPLTTMLEESKLIVGVAQGFGASIQKPGVAHHNAMRSILLGNFKSNNQQTIDRVVNQVSTVWQEVGFDCMAVPNIDRVQWEKLVCNSAYSGLCAINGLPIGEVMEHPQAGPISRAAATETWQVARDNGIHLKFEDPIQEIVNFATRMPKAKPSVLLDLEASRKSEIDFINGAVTKAAARVGKTAPINAAITQLVKSIELHQ